MLLMVFKEIGLSLLLLMGVTVSSGEQEAAHPFTHLSPIELKVAFAAKDAGIDPALALAMVYKESRFMPYSVSKTSDYGLLQVHCGKDWSWCRKFKVKKTDLFDIDTNLKYGFKIIEYCQAAAKKECRRKGKCRHWLFFYNHDSYYVKGVIGIAKKYRALLLKTLMFGSVS